MLMIAGAQQRHAQPRHQELAHEVDIERAPDVVDGELIDRTGRTGDPGIVD